MAFFVEKPPQMKGSTQEQINALRDYLFRMVKSLNAIDTAEADTTQVKIAYDKNGQQILSINGDADPKSVEQVRKNASELRSLIIKSAENLQNQINNIENRAFYVKYADDFAGQYPSAMYNVPTTNTYYMGVCVSTSATAPTNPALYTWSRIKGDGGTGLNSATVFLYRRGDNPPTKPQTDLTYTFASGRLTLDSASVVDHAVVEPDASVSGNTITFNTAEVEGHKVEVTGWTQEIPDSDGRPCWVITATAIATTATDVIGASEWSEVRKLVEDGAQGADGLNGRDGANGVNGRDGQDGADGLNGYSTAIVYLYKRSATAPTIDWTEAITYDFTSKAFTSVPTGWTSTVPNGEDPLYVTAATAMSREDTDAIAYTEWSTPTVMAENGTQGTPGPAGADGRTSYLHIKYSNDGQTFTENQGEDMGTWIGTYTDFTAEDSMVFSDYAWHRFADDTEIQEAIAAGDNYVMQYVDNKVEEYNSLYVAKSEYGTFTEQIQSSIETTARGVVESYDYGSSIQSMQENIDLMQDYYTKIDGEIRRGIILNPETQEYELGIAISQNLQFSGEICDSSDEHNPGDGHTYYYLNAGQTFGLYTATGWQFWIDGYKVGWFDSLDGMLHVSKIIVEDCVQFGGNWQLRSTAGGAEFELLYTGS